MGIHKLDLGEFDEIDYFLIAIHTSLEDYRMAYFINQHLSINLSKSESGIQINVKEGETNFSRFYFCDIENCISWNLIQNKGEIIQQKEATNRSLFSEVIMEVATKVFLLPELKKVDYFLKIDNTGDQVLLSQVYSILNNIDSISAFYTVEPNQIKSKNNLIF